MPNNLQFITVAALLGDREDAESLALTDVFGTDGSKNVYLDKMGRAASILGFTARNVAVTSSSGAAAMRLRAMWLYGSQSAGVLTRRLLGVFEGTANYELYVSDDSGGTWTLLANLGSGYVNYIPSFAQLGNECVIAFGTGAVQRYTGGSSIAAASSTQLAAPTTAASTNVGLLDGAYQWRIVPVISGGVRRMGSIPSSALYVNKKQATVTWTADSSAVMYEIYRTTGTGKVFFFESAVPAGTLTFTSNTTDLQLIAGRALQEYGDAPVSGIYHVAAHAERMWYGRTDTYPRRGWFSDPGLPYSVNSDSHFVDCTDAESFTDVMTGMTGGFQGMHVIWLERSVWTVSGKGRYSGPVLDFERRRTDAQTGTVSGRTVARVPAGSVYLNAQGDVQRLTAATLAYLTPLGDLRVFDGNNDIVVSWAKQDVLRRLSYYSRRKAFVITDTDHNEITWVFPIDTATEPNWAVSWNLRTGMLTEREWSFACAITVDSDGDSTMLLAGEHDLAVGGKCYELWSGTTFNGASIEAAVATKTFYARDRNGQPQLHETQRWRWVDLVVKNLRDTVTVLVEWWPTEADLESEPWGSETLTFGTDTLQSADGSDLQSADGSPLVVSLAAETLRAHFKEIKASTGNSRYLHARGIRLRITGQGSGQWALVGMKIAYQPTQGMKKAFRH